MWTVRALAVISLGTTLSYRPVGLILFVLTTVMAVRIIQRIPLLALALAVATWIALTTR